MKILKGMLITALVLVAIPLIAALFVKKDYAVEREVIIEKDSKEVFSFIKHLKNQSEYSVWQQRDPNMERTFTGTDGTVGFIASWKSENEEVGSGEQEITKIDEGKRIETELRFKEPFEATDQAYMETEAMEGNKTKVKWGFTGRMNYPMNVMLLFMDMEEMVGGDLQTGLDNLKGLMEKK
ncbi:MAG: polyketide cyclase [Bacteroidetes bacterium]|nr:MAG: polyketide cyclase [Bacteroidota bacterium]